MKLFKIVIIGLLCFTQLNAMKESGSSEINNPFSYKDSNGNTFFGSIKLKWKVWSLVGEPIHYLDASWNLEEIGLKGRGRVSPQGDEFHYIPKDVLKQVRLYDLQVSANIDTTKTMGLSLDGPGMILDAGVMSKPGYGTYGNKSFNTPGSTSWNKTLLGQGFNKYLNEEKTKQYYKKGFILKNFKIEKFKLDVSAVKQWLAKKERDKNKQILDEKNTNLISQSKLDEEYAKLKRKQYLIEGDKFNKIKARLNSQLKTAKAEQNRTLEEKTKKKLRGLSRIKKELAKTAKYLKSQQKKLTQYTNKLNKINTTYENKIYNYEKESQRARSFISDHRYVIENRKLPIGEDEIVSPYTGRIWKTKNVGAERVCQSYDDKKCYGELYTFNEAQDSCPSGFRLPTKKELEIETVKQMHNKRFNNYKNFLKLPYSGEIFTNDIGKSKLRSLGDEGYYWTSTSGGSFKNSSYSLNLKNNYSKAYMAHWTAHQHSLSVRCIKD